MAVLAGVALGEIPQRPRLGSMPYLLAMLGFGAWLAWLPHVSRVNASLAEARSYRNDGRMNAADPGLVAAELRRDDELRATAAFIAAHSRPDDFILTDYQLAAFIAKRRVAPEVAAFSSRAVAVGAFDDDMLLEAARLRRVPVVLLWDEEIAGFRSFAEALTEEVRVGPRYRHAIDLGRDRHIWLSMDAPSPELPEFGGFARLLGHVVDLRRLPGGGMEIDLRLFWQSLGHSRGVMSVFTHALGEDGKRHAQHDGSPAEGGLATSDWPLNTLIIDRHRIALPFDAPSRLELWIGFYDPSSGRRAPLAVGGESVDGATLRIDIIDMEVRR
jgi:hypothetical protein